MVDNKDFNEELKENIQEELDNETKAENPNIDEEVEEVSEDIKADEKVIDFEELKGMLVENSDEPYAEQIARKVMNEKKHGRPIETTTRLKEVIEEALSFLPEAEKKEAVKKSCQRTFQALRIAVNHELDALEEGLDTIFAHLAPGGRLCVITFHSLEDRLVKNKFRRWAQRCTCPPEQPICTCGGVAKAKLITRKPIEADAAELETNRRSRSAKLRVLEKA